MSSEPTADVERDGKRDDHLINHTVQTFTWSGLSAKIFVARSTPQVVLSELDGLVSAGKCIPQDL